MIWPDGRRKNKVITGETTTGERRHSSYRLLRPLGSQRKRCRLAILMTTSGGGTIVATDHAILDRLRRRSRIRAIINHLARPITICEIRKSCRMSTLLKLTLCIKVIELRPSAPC